MQAARPPPEVIKIEDSNSDDEWLSEDLMDPSNALDRVFFTHPDFASNGDLVDLVEEDGLLDRPLSQTADSDRSPPSYESCLARVLEVYPGISYEYVQKLFEDYKTAEQLIIQILNGGEYPKEKDRKQELKRKRETVRDSDEEEAAEVIRGEINVIRDYHTLGAETLAQEFLKVPKRYIDQLLKDKGRFYLAYLELERSERTYRESEDFPYRQLKTKRLVSLPSPVFRQREPNEMGLHFADAVGPQEYGIQQLRRELHAARKKRRKDDVKRQVEKDRAAADAAQDKEYFDRGDVMECKCCYTDSPMNKTTHCSGGSETHFFCFECAQNNAKNELGNQRWRLRCMDESGCTAEFDRSQAVRFLDVKTLDALERLQTQDEIQLAQVEDLTACPFCDFAAICPPKEIDREFRCHNPECEKVSCRLCEAESHIPRTCEELKKEKGVSERHTIEEAMTAALLRECPKCKKKYVKDMGCNKMVCPFCSSIQCYVCKKDISKEGYAHFNERGNRQTGGKCPLQDDSDERHKEEIEKAAKEAQGRVRQDNPGLTEDDLKIEFTDAVNRSPRHPTHPPDLAMAGIDFRRGRMGDGGRGEAEEVRRQLFLADQQRGLYMHAELQRRNYVDMPWQQEVGAGPMNVIYGANPVPQFPNRALPPAPYGLHDPRGVMGHGAFMNLGAPLPVNPPPHLAGIAGDDHPVINQNPNIKNAINNNRLGANLHVNFDHPQPHPHPRARQ